MDFDFSLVTQSMPLLLAGALVTLKIMAMAVGLGMVFGFIAAVGFLSRNRVFHSLARTYVNFIRGTLLLVQIFSLHSPTSARVSYTPSLELRLSI